MTYQTVGLSTLTELGLDIIYTYDPTNGHTQTKKKFKRVVTDFSKASERADKFSKDLKKKSGG